MVKNTTTTKKPKTPQTNKLKPNKPPKNPTTPTEHLNMLKTSALHKDTWLVLDKPCLSDLVTFQRRHSFWKFLIGSISKS